MRVLHVTQPTTAGVARVVAQYASACQDAGLSTAVACPPQGRLAADLAGLGVPHLSWQARRSPGPSALSEAVHLSGLIRQWEPDVVHLHSSKAGMVGRLAIRGSTPTVFQPHAWSFDAATGPLAAASLRWERWGARWSHRTVCVGDMEVQTGQSSGITGPYKVIPNRVDLTEWGTVGRGEARRRLGLAAHAPIAVCVGRICRQKGQDVLVAAWQSIRSDLPAAQLYLVGEQQEPIDIAPGSGVVMAGPAEPHLWYAAADVVVIASRWEGMPLVALEAQASGRVIVATRQSAASETLVAPADEVPAQAPDALARVLSRRLRSLDDTRALGERARAAAHNRPRLDRLGSELSSLYQLVSAGNPDVPGQRLGQPG